MYTKRTILFILLLFLGGHRYLVAQVKQGNTLRVHIRVIEEDTREVTPVMVCITNKKNNKSSVPPRTGQPYKLILTDSIYYSGIDFSPHKNWIGPVRKMNGLGDNKDRSYVYDLLPSIPYWKEQVMYQTSGDFVIDFTPGHWRINLEHGNEYIPINDEFTITKNNHDSVKTFTLKRWINMPDRGWYSGDVHVHHPTTKQLFREYLLSYAKAEDLHLINVLEQGNDHETKGSRQAGFGKEYRIKKGNIWLVSGQEDPSSRFGHIIGLNIDHLIREVTTYNYYDIVFKKLKLQPGSIVGYAHFSWNGCDLPRGFPWLITTGDIDFVELLQFSRINILDYYDYLNLGYRITAAAGSDFPWGSTIGEVRTFVYTGHNFTADTWFNGLKSGHTFVTNGPVLFLEADNKLPGSEIIKPKGSVAEIKLKAISNPAIGTISNLLIYNNDGLIAEAINTEKSDSLSISINHHLTKSQWLTAMVYCENGAVAHTSPVYFIVDGKPTWSKEKAPAIIRKQLNMIGLIEVEEKSKPEVDSGIIKRLENARKTYFEFLSLIQKDK